ncbi:hypothetical protein [Nocardia sp. NRRL S-836]|nr:hypothetical protein [Nocardia sp. NRRL S-836]
MNGSVPRSITSGRRVAMALLVLAMIATALLVVWLVALDVTAPVVV